MPGLSSDVEDALLAWIEAAQPVSRLCEVSLVAQRGNSAGSQRAATSADAVEVSAPGAAAGAVSRPSQLTYGELPLRQLKFALAKVREHGGLDGAQAGGCRFIDLGCGGGKLVLAAAIMLIHYHSVGDHCITLKLRVNTKEGKRRTRMCCVAL